MKDRLELFFEKVADKIIDYMDSSCKIIITAGNKCYTLEFPEKGKVKVHEGRKDGDIEIIGEECVMNDLFSSTTMDDYISKLCNYNMKGKKPKLKILMERNQQNIRKFLRRYYIPLFKLYILR